jgi:CRISP-associated protein Cas1
MIAKIDLLTVEDGRVTPVDYKRGKPPETGEGPDLWPPDRIQLRYKLSSCAKTAT